MVRSLKKSGRGDRIRTCDICVPNAALYQAELLPVTSEGGNLCQDCDHLASRNRCGLFSAFFSALAQQQHQKSLPFPNTCSRCASARTLNRARLPAPTAASKVASSPAPARIPPGRAIGAPWHVLPTPLWDSPQNSPRTLIPSRNQLATQEPCRSVLLRKLRDPVHLGFPGGEPGKGMGLQRQHRLVIQTADRFA